MGRWTKAEEPRYRKADKSALHIRQVPELGEDFRVWIARHAGKLDYYDQKIGQEGLVNALLAEFLKLPLKDQLARLRAGIEIAEGQERAWNREMHELVLAGVLMTDEKKNLWTPEEWAEKQAKAGQDKPDPESTGGRPTRPRAPKAGRKRA